MRCVIFDKSHYLWGRSSIYLYFLPLRALSSQLCCPFFVPGANYLPCEEWGEKTVLLLWFHPKWNIIYQKHGKNVTYTMGILIIYLLFYLLFFLLFDFVSWTICMCNCFESLTKLAGNAQAPENNFKTQNRSRNSPSPVWRCGNNRVLIQRQETRLQVDRLLLRCVAAKRRLCSS